MAKKQEDIDKVLDWVETQVGFAYKAAQEGQHDVWKEIYIKNPAAQQMLLNNPLFQQLDISMHNILRGLHESLEIAPIQNVPKLQGSIVAYSSLVKFIERIKNINKEK